MKSRNLVAKHARKFNKSAVHRDKKNDYSRKEKHSKSEKSVYNQEWKNSEE